MLIISAPVVRRIMKLQNKGGKLGLQAYLVCLASCQPLFILREVRRIGGNGVPH